MIRGRPRGLLQQERAGGSFPISNSTSKELENEAIHLSQAAKENPLAYLSNLEVGMPTFFLGGGDFSFFLDDAHHLSTSLLTLPAALPGDAGAPCSLSAFGVHGGRWFGEYGSASHPNVNTAPWPVLLTPQPTQPTDRPTDQPTDRPPPRRHHRRRSRC